MAALSSCSRSRMSMAVCSVTTHIQNGCAIWYGAGWATMSCCTQVCQSQPIRFSIHYLCIISSADGFNDWMVTCGAVEGTFPTVDFGAPQTELSVKNHFMVQQKHSGGGRCLVGTFHLFFSPFLPTRPKCELRVLHHLVLDVGRQSNFQAANSSCPQCHRNHVESGHSHCSQIAVLY
jgi:hypothetical protein